ncbi:hypothetical protein FH972_010815 [Carpinus fangiana]|uniref:UDP-glycosyltransferases domain-containing protein n=1 Tax=Carpinus fangiana TaxID=176857 RepID=A0A660KRF7_9ROSI|nr:hypothetical protein FH972_010815 [Carpinus fangiana]
MESSKPHAIIVSSPGVGHLVRDLELGNRMVADHNFQLTFIVLEYPIKAGETQLIQSAKAQKLLDIVELPPVDLSGQLQPNAPIFTRLTAVMCEIRETLWSAIFALKPTPSALIVDTFGTPALDVTDEFHMLKYVFVSFVWPLALMLYLTILDKEVGGEYVDEKEPMRLPGCILPVRPEDVLVSMMDRTKQEYNFLLQVTSKMRESDGVLTNTWEDLDATTLKAMREEKSYGSVQVYEVGPLIRPVVPPTSRSQLLDWLDEQPVESVLYIEFGSLVLSAQQITKLASGLELSQQRFIWVLRSNKDAHASANRDDAMLAYLPDGFLKRTHESILSGVPMTAWPLYAEQKMNATMLAQEVGVAVRPKVAPIKGVVGREEIEMIVRKVIYGGPGREGYEGQCVMNSQMHGK